MKVFSTKNTHCPKKNLYNKKCLKLSKKYVQIFAKLLEIFYLGLGQFLRILLNKVQTSSYVKMKKIVWISKPKWWTCFTSHLSCHQKVIFFSPQLYIAAHTILSILYQHWSQSFVYHRCWYIRDFDVYEICNTFNLEAHVN